MSIEGKSAISPNSLSRSRIQRGQPYKRDSLCNALRKPGAERLTAHGGERAQFQKIGAVFALTRRKSPLREGQRLRTTDSALAAWEFDVDDRAFAIL